MGLTFVVKFTGSVTMISGVMTNVKNALHISALNIIKIHCFDTPSFPWCVPSLDGFEKTMTMHEQFTKALSFNADMTHMNSTERATHCAKTIGEQELINCFEKK